MLRKPAEISAPSIFQGIQIVFGISVRKLEKILELQNRSSFGKKNVFLLEKVKQKTQDYSELGGYCRKVRF